MDEIGSGLSTEEMAELCALADGTLPAERRAAVEARVAASPELLEILKRQRLALAAVETLADEPCRHRCVPSSTSAGVRGGRAAPTRTASRATSSVSA